MIEYNLLKDALSTAMRFVGKTTDLGKNFNLKSDGSYFEMSASDGNYAYYCCLENSDSEVFDVAVNGPAFSALVSAFEDGDMIKTTVFRNNLILESSSGKYKMPFQSSENVWHAPKPVQWIEAPTPLITSLLAMRDAPVKQKSKSIATILSVKDDYIVTISPYFIYFEPCSLDVSFKILYDDIARLMKNFTHICLQDGQVYFGGPGEWCMIPESQQKELAFKPLLTEVQKTNICGININVSNLTNLLTRFKAVAKATDILMESKDSLQTASQIDLSVTPKLMTVRSELAEIEIGIETESEFEEINFTTNVDFLLSMVKGLFSREESSTTLHVGYGMRMVGASCGGRMILGTTYKSRS